MRDWTYPRVALPGAFRQLSLGMEDGKEFDTRGMFEDCTQKDPPLNHIINSIQYGT